MLSAPAYAQQAAAAAPSGAEGIFLQFAPLVFIFGIFYFLLIRPQQKRAKEFRAMIAAVQKGDMVVTGGGLVGRVTSVSDTEVEVELGPNMRVKAVKSTLSSVKDPKAREAANDTAK